MPSVEGPNEIEFLDRGTGLRADRGGHARQVDLVHLVCLVHLVGLVQPNKRDKLNKPNNGLLALADCVSLLLVELLGRRCRAGCMHRQGARGSPCFLACGVFS